MAAAKVAEGARFFICDKDIQVGPFGNDEVCPFCPLAVGIKDMVMPLREFHQPAAARPIRLPTKEPRDSLIGDRKVTEEELEQDIARLDDPDFTTPSPIMRTTWGDGRRQGNSLEVDTFVNYPSSNDISLFNAVEFCQTIAQMLKGTGPSVVSGDTVS